MTQQADPYAVLFEPVKIGPLTAVTAFTRCRTVPVRGGTIRLSVPTFVPPKAEGGWAVVSTEQCDIHYSADMRAQVRLWNEGDIPFHAV
ncbi:MAG: hypothetical protein CM1200mP18_20300 [Gammaproteobacteria bacterium]|nr:MAG: hypothetical protein CM1200mP18_20300 [Gammaproteobacteria bacterium]